MQQLVRDGVALHYQEAGSGAPPVLLVHGWTHDHTYLAPQFERLRSSHRVVAVDLRGHGRSDKPDQDYTMAGFADDLAWLTRELGLHRPVVIGHSMGGVVALDLAARYPGPASRGRDARLAGLPAAAAAREGALGRRRLKTPDYRAVQGQLVRAVSFDPADDPARADRIVAAHGLGPTARHGDRVREPVQPRQRGRGVGLPGSDPVRRDRALVSPTWPGSARYCPGLVTGQIVGSGHYFTLEVPEQVNPMIERFIATTVPAPSAR